MINKSVIRPPMLYETESCPREIRCGCWRGCVVSRRDRARKEVIRGTVKVTEFTKKLQEAGHCGAVV